MTQSEIKFRRWANKKFPNAYIKKIPDFKAGSTGNPGLPDYIIIEHGETIWVEVKQTGGKTLNLKNHFTDAQKIEFHKMLQANCDVMIYWQSKSAKHAKIVRYSDLEEFGSLKL